MSLPRPDEASRSARSLCLDLNPIRLAGWLAIVLILSKGFSLDRSRHCWWVLDLSMASYNDVFFALALGALASLILWAWQGQPAVASGLRRAFVGFCVLCTFYAVVAAGVFTYFGRPLSYDLLKLVHGVAALKSSISDRLTPSVLAALIGVPGAYYLMARCLVRRRKAPVVMVMMLLAWSAFGCWQYYERPRPYFMPHLSVNPHIELVRSTWNGLTGPGRPLLRTDYPRHYQDEFRPRAWRAAAARGVSVPVAHEAPPKNVIVIVLESVGTKYLSLYGSKYKTTPSLNEEAAFLSNGDMEWAGMSYVLENQGYDVVEDYRAMGGASLTSWGAEDRVLFERLIRFLDDLGRYLNVLLQVDRHIGEFFRALRDRGLAEDTLVVITGDHGEAFGDPHDQRGHGFTAYQEDVNVPLILWNPRLFPGGRRLDTIGGHVDLNATIADLLCIPASGDWQGYSLFDPSRPRRAYYLASIGEYLFGVRDGKWKYIYQATSGREFLTDLTADPHELQNSADSEPDVCRELRHRVSAWWTSRISLCGRPAIGNRKSLPRHPNSFLLGFSGED
jgi:sulfatase-like protein